jgi:hypothetical protein
LCSDGCILETFLTSTPRAFKASKHRSCAARRTGTAKPYRLRWGRNLHAWTTSAKACDQPLALGANLTAACCSKDGGVLQGEQGALGSSSALML